jgi:hypothetical protein
MSLLSRAAFILCLACLLVTACGGRKSTGEITASEKQAFDSAPPELKQMWLSGLEAVSTNDYAGAQTLFYGLLTQQLSPPQRQAVTKESTFVMDRIYAGIDKGDPAALKAAEELRRNPPNRQPR